MVEPVADAGCADAFPRIGHYAGGSDLEENGRSAGLKLRETVNRAQAVEKRQRRLDTDGDRRGVVSGRGDRACRRAHPRADACGVHPCIVVRGVLDLVREGAAGGRPQHEEDGHGQRAGNRPEQRSDHWYALRTRNHLIYSGVTLSIPPLWGLVRLASKRASPPACARKKVAWHLLGHETWRVLSGMSAFRRFSRR